MAKMTISMPHTMSEYITSLVETGQYRNVSEYFRELVSREQQSHSALRKLLENAEANASASAKSQRL